MENKKTVILSFLIAFVIVVALIFVDNTTAALAYTMHDVTHGGCGAYDCCVAAMELLK